MRIVSGSWVAVFLGMTIASGADGMGSRSVKLKAGERSISVEVGGKAFTHYRFKDEDGLAVAECQHAGLRTAK